MGNAASQRPDRFQLVGCPEFLGQLVAFLFPGFTIRNIRDHTFNGDNVTLLISDQHISLIDPANLSQLSDDLVFVSGAELALKKLLPFFSKIPNPIRMHDFGN